MKRKGGLGRGLNALLGAGPEEDAVANDGKHQVQGISIASIEPNPYQPRRHFDQDALTELAESIKIQGVIQPITVRSLGGGRYQLIAGERRWQASQKAGLTEIPAYVRTATDQQMLEVALIENIQREDLNAMEVAHSYQRLISEIGLTQEEMADRVGKNRSTVTNYLRLLRLPEAVQQALSQGQLTMGHAKAILGLAKPDQQLNLYRRVIAKGMNVRDTEEAARQYGKATAKPKGGIKSALDTELKSIQSRLAETFGAKVLIKQKGKQKGEITIPYQNTEDLNRVLEQLGIN